MCMEMTPVCSRSPLCGCQVILMDPEAGGRSDFSAAPAPAEYRAVWPIGSCDGAPLLQAWDGLLILSCWNLLRGALPQLACRGCRVSICCCGSFLSDRCGSCTLPRSAR